MTYRDLYFFRRETVAEGVSTDPENNRGRLSNAGRELDTPDYPSITTFAQHLQNMWATIDAKQGSTLMLDNFFF